MCACCIYVCILQRYRCDFFHLHRTFRGALLFVCAYPDIWFICPKCANLYCSCYCTTLYTPSIISPLSPFSLVILLSNYAQFQPSTRKTKPPSLPRLTPIIFSLQKTSCYDFLLLLTKDYDKNIYSSGV